MPGTFVEWVGALRVASVLIFWIALYVAITAGPGWPAFIAAAAVANVELLRAARRRDEGLSPFGGTCGPH